MSEDISPIREVLNAEFDKMASAEPSVQADAAPAAPATTPEAPPATDTDTSGRARNELGRFTKPSTAVPPAEKPGTPSPAIEGQGEAAGTPPAASPAVPEAPKWKPPQSWKPNVREKWAALPPEVQEEADRLDKEYQRIMREDADLRKSSTQVKEALAPYEGLARSQGMDPVRYAGSVLQTAAALHMGTPQQKAAIVAQLIGSYGIDVDAVNAVMQGQAPAQPTPQTQPVNVQAEVRRVFEEMQNQTLTSQAQSAIDKTKAECEFWNDVGQGKIVTLAAGLINAEPELAKTPDVALKTAYDMLSQRTPEISGVLKQRQEAEAAKARLASTQQAKVAGGSIRSQPAAVGQAKPTGIREALELGWKQQHG